MHRTTAAIGQNAARPDPNYLFPDRMVHTVDTSRVGTRPASAVEDTSSKSRHGDATIGWRQPSLFRNRHVLPQDPEVRRKMLAFHFDPTRPIDIKTALLYKRWSETVPRKNALEASDRQIASLNIWPGYAPDYYLKQFGINFDDDPQMLATIRKLLIGKSVDPEHDPEELGKIDHSKMTGTRKLGLDWPRIDVKTVAAHHLTPDQRAGFFRAKLYRTRSYFPRESIAAAHFYVTHDNVTLVHIPENEFYGRQTMKLKACSDKMHVEKLINVLSSLPHVMYVRVRFDIIDYTYFFVYQGDDIVHLATYEDILYTDSIEPDRPFSMFAIYDREGKILDSLRVNPKDRVEDITLIASDKKRAHRYVEGRKL